MIKLENVLTYANSVYQIGEQVNSLRRKNLKASIKASTGVKAMLVGVMCQNSSINEIMETTYISNTFKNIYSPREIKPKTHGLRDCLIDTPYEQVKEINKRFVKKIKENKVFRNNTIDNLVVVAFDGTEEFETNKKIEGLPERKHKDGRKSCYHKTFGVMQIGEKNQIMIRMEELKAKEIVEIKNTIAKENGIKEEEISDTRIKSEGEITVLKRVLPEIEEEIGEVVDVLVGDALFDRVTVLNTIKASKKDYVIRTKDERRKIRKDAEGLFRNRKANEELELVEILTTKKTIYSKKSKKKNKIRTKKERIYRKSTEEKLNEEKITSKKITNKKNSKTEIIEKERVIKKIEVWTDLFELEEYNEGKVRFVKYVEKDGKEEKEIYVITSLLNHKLETILKIMHKRWLIENNGFRVLKTRYNLDHCYVGEINAIRLIIEIIMLVYNIMQMYINIRTQKHRENKITKKIFKKIFESEISRNKKIYLIILDIKT